MTRWTENNTEGFTVHELDVLNRAQAAVEAAAPELDPANIADRLNNAWIPGMTEAALIAAALA